jgi:hypothetical protein
MQKGKRVSKRVRRAKVKTLNKYSKKQLRDRFLDLSGEQVKLEHKIKKTTKSEKIEMKKRERKVSKEIEKTKNVFNRRFYKKPR